LLDDLLRRHRPAGDRLSAAVDGLRNDVRGEAAAAVPPPRPDIVRLLPNESRRMMRRRRPVCRNRMQMARMEYRESGKSADDAKRHAA
jgi:hypothetical protein